MRTTVALLNINQMTTLFPVHAIAAEKVNTRVCANLTLVLDNWKFAIMTQVKDLLLNDHSTVLPDYGRIPPLSDALGDLYKEFNALKERLGELTTKFEGVEAFVDDVRAGRSPSQRRNEVTPRHRSGISILPENRHRPTCIRGAKHILDLLLIADIIKVFWFSYG
uniref:Si:ch73-127m5.3 n=1 Tax=Oncorhynchus mykiss TaxID=8022 RepID=A0A8C7V7K8_ONCMY